MPVEISHQAKVPDNMARQRLDHVAALLFPQYSRSRLQSWIKSGGLKVNGEALRTGSRLFGGEHIAIEVVATEVTSEPEDIALDIVYEDEALLVVNKPMGLVVHPGAGNLDGTLLNALLFYCPSLDAVPRAGIVHRLDKDTTGLLVVAKTLESQHRLVQQLQDRSVKRIYEAVVYGTFDGPGRVDAPIGRHPSQRTKMTVRKDGKEAMTRFRVLKQFGEHTRLEVSLETGRTHQIRVHMQHIHRSLIGDKTYGGGYKIPRNGHPALLEALQLFPRPALHARELSLQHPLSDEGCHWSVPIPADLEGLLASLNLADIDDDR
jgi:23S rRNA pseudouridine1911/1915/1917 synthase